MSSLSIFTMRLTRGILSIHSFTSSSSCPTLSPILPRSSLLEVSGSRLSSRMMSCCLSLKDSSSSMPRSYSLSSSSSCYDEQIWSHSLILLSRADCRFVISVHSSFDEFSIGWFNCCSYLASYSIVASPSLPVVAASCDFSGAPNMLTGQ